MDPLIKEQVEILRIDPAARVYLGHPTVLALPGGRILVAVDAQGPDIRDLPGQKSRIGDSNHWIQGRLFVSGDEGKTWTQKQEFPFGYPCLFRDGNQLYLLGHRGPLTIMRSQDGGETWSKPSELAPKGGETSRYTHSPCSVTRANGHLHVVLLRVAGDPQKRTGPEALAPVLLRAPEGFNLTVSKSWTWSEAGPTLPQAQPDWSTTFPQPPLFDPAPAPPARDHEPSLPGWMFPHVVAVTNPQHLWHHARGNAIHVLAAVQTPRGNLAACFRFLEQPDGAWRADLQPFTPGRRPLWLQVPGAERRFHVIADPESRQHLLLSTQGRGALMAPEAGAPPGRGRTGARPHVLQLSFSANLADWVQAGWVGGTPADPLTDPVMDIRGKDLCVAACGRSAEDPTNRHAKRLVFGMVRDFRNLYYALS